jgi:hypothetical protein
MFPDVADQTNLIAIQPDNAHRIEALDKRLPEIDKLHAERILRLARRYESYDNEGRVI